METSERHVRTWIATGNDDEITQLVSGISSGQTSLLNLVKALGEYLTSEEDILRTKGVDLLSRVIERCPPERINRPATHVLVKFYVGKLDDSETAIPALKGLVSLSSLSSFSDDDALETIKSLFAHINMKDFNQSTRYLVFRILDSSMARHRTTLQGMSDAFLTGYTTLVDGEKDPRNLLIAFSMDRVICIEFDISRHVESLFNVIFCYFPITFKPPSDDPYGISAEDLRLALRSCMNASPRFGELAIQLFMDKLLGGSPATKKDIIETISMCLPIYGPAVARKHAKKLWNFLKMEVFQPVNPEIEGEALKATQTLICTIYGTEGRDEKATDKLHGLAADICTECLELMGEPGKSQAIPASKMIASLIGTTPSISKAVISQALPHLMKLFRDPDELTHRSQILTLLCVVVGSIGEKRATLVEYGLQGELLAYKDDVLGAFMAGLKNPGSYEAALEGIKKLSQMPHALSNEELVYVVHNVNEILQSDADEADIATDDALSVLASIAEESSKVVEEHTLPLLFTFLPDLPPSRAADRERAKCWRTLHLLARLCVSAPLFETLVVRLTTKLDIVCTPREGSSDSEEEEPRVAYAHAILKTLASVTELKANANHPDLPKYIDRLVPRLYDLFIYLSLRGDSMTSGGLSPKLLDVAGQIITLVVRRVSLERQQRLVDALCAAYFNGDVEPLCGRHQAFRTNSVFTPFKADSSTAQRNTVVLLSAAFVAFHKDIPPPGPEPNETLANVQSWILNTSDADCQHRSCNHLLASLVNKNLENLSPFISRQLNAIFREEIANSEGPADRRRQAIQTWIWIGKAIAVLNSQLIMDFVESLFKEFDDVDVGWDAAKAVGEIASGGDDVLTKANHAVIRILYAQKYHKVVLPKVLENLKGDPQAPGYGSNLVALTALISSLPKTAYASDIPTLMPYLIRGLDLLDNEIKMKIINTLTVIAGNGSQGSIQEHATTLVSLVLKNAIYQESSSAALRTAALNFLTVLPKVVRYDVLHPIKASVIRELGKALDDPKRSVRKEAVSARAAWFAYKG